HLDDLVLEPPDLVAQHLHLPLLQRHRAHAVRTGQAHRGQRFGVALEEARRLEQVACDLAFADGRHRSISPSNTVCAGPVITTLAFSPGHSIVSTPPRVCTSTLPSSQPSRTPATTEAQAPVPQASVSPAWRSNTRSAIC